MKELKDVLSENLTTYRKLAKLTQLEVAEKIAYSDKAISKWERGDGAPDVFVLQKLATLYGVSISDLMEEKKKSNVISTSHTKRHVIITTLSVGIAWLVATSLYVLLSMFVPNLHKVWLSFIVAIPVSAIVLTVFSCIWGNRIQITLSVSLLVWSMCLTLFLCIPIYRNWMWFLVGVPLQAMIIIWHFLKRIPALKKLDFKLPSEKQKEKQENSLNNTKNVKKK